MSQQSANFGLERRVKFGCYLKNLRKSRRIRLVHVAKEFGVNLSEIEKGKRPASEELLAKLAKKYNVRFEDMLERKYRPQLSLLTGIIRPAEVVEDLLKDLRPEEKEEIIQEIKRYTAFLLLIRNTANDNAARAGVG